MIGVGILKKIWRKLFPEKHHVTVIYPDRTFYYRITYPKNGMFTDERGNTYYIDRNKTVHVFIGGYANEIDGAKVSKDAKRYEFEPSETFKIAMEGEIRKAIYRMGGVNDFLIYALIGCTVIVAGLTVLNYIEILKVVEALTDVGVIK